MREQNQFGGGVTIGPDCTDIPGNIVLSLDRARIECVLDNLLANALEAIHGGGAIHVSAVALETSVLIEIRDTGPKIAPAIRDRLFQPFVTAGKAKGLGLGLAASHQAVIEHGGQIWLQSAPGWGAASPSHCHCNPK